MRAVRCKVHGLPETLIVGDIAFPVWGSGEVLVQMRVPQDKLLAMPEGMLYKVAVTARNALMRHTVSGKLAVLP